MYHVPHPSAARNPRSGDVGTVDRRMAPMCGRPLHIISHPQSTLSIFRGCGKRKAQPAAALTGPWKSSENLLLIRSHLGHLHLPASTSQPAAGPSLCTPQTPPKTPKSSHQNSWHLASGWATISQGGVATQKAHQSEVVAPPGPPLQCLPLAPSDFKPGTPPGLVTK